LSEPNPSSSAAWPKNLLETYLRSLRPLCILLMHSELPGFYSDAEKNRDFPSSSKKEGKSQHPPDARSPAARPHTSEAAAPSPSPSSSTSLPQMHRRSTTDTWHTLQQLRIATSPRQRIATTQLRFATLAATYPNSYLSQMCQQDDDSSARGLSGISGYPLPCLRHRPDHHSVCCTLSTPKTIYMIMTYTAHRLELTMAARGPLPVTTMAYYIHLILPLWKISCQ
jgi:hypothetical protein